MSHLHPPVVVAIGHDGSPGAIDHAAQEARRLDRGLHLVHATGGTSRADRGHRVLAAAVQRAESHLAGLAPVTTELTAEPPLVALLAAATHASLVVVGRSKVRPHPYHRSVTGGIASRVHAPVLAVPDDAGRRSAAHRVVVGYDEGANCEEALVEAFAAARARGAELTILASWWHPGGATRHPLPRAHGAEEIAEGVDRASAHLRAWYSDVPVEVSVVHAPAGDALVAASRDAELVVLGRHETVLPVGSHLGPVARAVLREAACPVLLATPVDAHRVEPAVRTAQHA